MILGSEPSPKPSPDWLSTEQETSMSYQDRNGTVFDTQSGKPPVQPENVKIQTGWGNTADGRWNGSSAVPDKK